MRVSLVGPTHPYKGGVAAHTTELARRLAAAGHDCDLISWSHLYPARLYPGEQTVPDGVPDLPPYPRTRRPLSWARPDSWVRAGRALRRHDLVVVVHVVPALAPAHVALLKAAGALPRTVVIAHNVLPHEPHRGAAALVHALLASADATLVHSSDQGFAARRHGARTVHVASLPPHLPGGAPVPRTPHEGPVRLLALGLVRDYKGLDLLVEALGQVPSATLTVAGELWGDAGARVRELASRPSVRGRVTLRSGYVPSAAIAGLLAEHDVLALPYRAATSSQNALLGHAHGLPVLATRVGTFGSDVRDGVDGVLADPGSVPSLVAALQRVTAPGALAGLRAGVRRPDLDAPWRRYVDVLVEA